MLVWFYLAVACPMDNPTSVNDCGAQIRQEWYYDEATCLEFGETLPFEPIKSICVPVELPIKQPQGEKL